MTEKTHDIGKITKDMEVSKEKLLFKKRLMRLNGIASVFKDKGVEVQLAEQQAQNCLEALDVEGGLQAMLAMQMLSVHQLQQFSMMVVNRTAHIENRQYFTNTAIKLANTFAQQANLLNKLQSASPQNIIVKRVDVHDGGQAVVGNINTASSIDRGKK